MGELREVAQASKVMGDRRWWYVAFRRVSIYVTWALLHTGVTPNQVTVASLGVALAGLVMAGAPAAWLSVAGYVALLAYHLLDRVDGEIARVRNTHSLHGIYLDNAGHYLTGAGVFIAATYRLLLDTSHPELLWLLGVTAGVAAAMARVEKHAAFHLFSQYVIERPQLARRLVATSQGALTRGAVRASRSSQDGSRRRSPIEIARDGSLAITAFPSVVSVLLIATLIEIATGDQAPARWALIGLSVAQILTYLALEAAMLTQSLATETNRLLDELESPDAGER